MVADTLNQLFRIQCTSCGQPCSVSSADILAGVAISCPSCGTRLVVPVSESNESPARDGSGPSSIPHRAKAPTGRLKPVAPLSFVAPTLVSEVTANPGPAVVETTATETAISEPSGHPPAEPVHPSPPGQHDRDVPMVDPTERDSQLINVTEDTTEEPRRSRRSRNSSSKRSSPRRSSPEPRWNEIGVDGLPILDAAELATEEEPHGGTQLRDVTGLLLAFGLSLMLTQAGLWWVAGIDPLGIAPTFSSWLPNVVPSDLAQ
jgi:hypothetical protein